MIDIQNLKFSYSRKTTLFENLELQLQEGKIYGLLGKNGTGKSTLLKLLLGLHFPKDGLITIDGHNSVKRNPNLLEDIFFLSEDYELPNISIASYVKAQSPFYPKFDHSKFAEILKTFEVEKEAILSQLSYGQKKKTVIAFGIATNTKYLFMDEPTNGLDIPSKSQFRKVLLSGFRDDQIIIISTHQIRDLNQLIESVIIIEDGKIIFNKDVSVLEEKLSFNKSLSQDNGPSIVYSELMPGGYISIAPNTNGEPGEVELEVLFNAVINNPKAINQLI
ncbi:MAG: ABC transporter ATP-binding protein [Saprospiraceae bacterium]|nr:ABC transporter ATP-binding protein [Bacteroidia bacterium]NNE15937.1 ABC transporter ATP-binding protein [Saprospiraceae bacterium]NNL93648.1 ABC transporter ATP-binding protein [Saprospiraceae bacterium]